MSFTLRENARYKLLASEGYNYRFDKLTGFFLRWGKTLDDDPPMGPGPEIMDLEISTICHGPGKPCRFCYKANTPKGEQMTFETFKAIFDKVAPVHTVLLQLDDGTRVELSADHEVLLVDGSVKRAADLEARDDIREMKIQEIQKIRSGPTQIAFGIGDMTGHDDMWLMFEYCRANGVVPNVTINGWQITDEIADRLVSVMGAVAVSRYNPKDTCYDAVKMLTDRGMRQVNIHQVVSEETYESCMEVLADRETDPRLAKLNAVVLLMLKPKGRASHGMTKINPFKYRKIVEKARSQPFMVGFDSCSTPSFTHTLIGEPGADMVNLMADHCESGLFSIYANVRGFIHPCSFTDGTPGWEKGLSILEADDFIRDIWNHPRLDEWRQRLRASSTGCTSCSLSSGCRSCPIYPVDTCKE